MTGVRLVPYEPQVHGAYVRKTWCHGSRLPWHALADLLRRPESRALVAVAEDDADAFLGWAVVHGEDLVWWHVRYEELVRPLRHQLLQALRIDPDDESIAPKLPLTKEAA